MAVSLMLARVTVAARSCASLLGFGPFTVPHLGAGAVQGRIIQEFGLASITSTIGSTLMSIQGLRPLHRQRPPHHLRALGWLLEAVVRRTATVFKARTTRETMATMRSAPLTSPVRSPSRLRRSALRAAMISSPWVAKGFLEAVLLRVALTPEPSPGHPTIR